MKIQINRRSNQSLSDQIVEALENAIETKWYVVGDKLPSIRVLSKELSVSPMTVVVAYEALERSGYVTKIHGKGIFVAKQERVVQAVPMLTENRPMDSGHIWQDHIRDYVTRNKYAHRTVQFDTSIKNLSTAALHKRFQSTDKVLNKFNSSLKSLEDEFDRYPPVEGHGRFREELVKYFSEKNVICTKEQLIVTSGSQLGIHLIAETFLGPGDVVVVGAPTFPGAIDVFKNRGAVVIDVPIDTEGMKMDNLMAVCERYPVKLVYVMATFQNPTGICLSYDRSLELLELADEYNFLILEDDSWGELSYDVVMRPLKSIDRNGRVLYLGGFSKYLGPAFRLSAIVTEGSLHSRLVAAKSNIDSGAPLLNQCMLVSYMNTIDRKQHMTWLCYELKALLGRVVKKIDQSFPKFVSYKVPRGGLVLWFTLPNKFDTKLLYYRCITEGKLSILLGENCYASARGENKFRLCYTYESEDVVMESIEVIGRLIYEIDAAGKRPAEGPMF